MIDAFTFDRYEMKFFNPLSSWHGSKFLRNPIYFLWFESKSKYLIESIEIMLSLKDFRDK